MTPSGSVIDSIIEQVRFLLEEAKVDKYTDDYLLRHVVQDAYATVWADLQLGRDDPICLQMAFSTVANQKRLILPPNVQSVERIAQYDATSGDIAAEWYPRDLEHPAGPSWFIEGNMLGFRPYAGAAADWELWYWPSGDFMLHKGTGTVGAEETVGTETGVFDITLDATPEIGMIDRRDNAYAGGVFRVLEDGKPWTERYIDSFDPTTRVITLRHPIDAADLPAADADVDYEIAPVSMSSMIGCIAAHGAKILGVSRDISDKKMKFLEAHYYRGKKTLHDRLTNTNAHLGRHFRRNTRDNDNWGWNPFNR